MNRKRAIGIGILVYLGGVLLGMGVWALLGITPDPSMAQPIPVQMWIAMAVISVVLSVLAALWYFRGKNLRPSLRAGLGFGLAVVLTGVVLDLLFFWSLSFSGYSPMAAIRHYYGQPAFWVTLALILVGSGLAGKWLEGKAAVEYKNTL